MLDLFCEKTHVSFSLRDLTCEKTHASFSLPAHFNVVAVLIGGRIQQ